ncbi:MAG: ABC transporter substrate-binding protein [Planctomycetes bacterium]|nr:ABC transporter substrate-binding protein [Planctomycetota bacterium]
MRTWKICFIGLYLFGAGDGNAPASRPVIRLGMSAAFTGPSAQLGSEMRDGIRCAIEICNQSGGIGGSHIDLIALDDGYEPARTVPNIHKLLNEHNVISLIGNVGTPTAVAALPILNERKTVLFGAFTGAGALRKSPPDPYVINYRASYAEETGAMVDALVGILKLQPREIGLFTQRDAYGDAGYAGAIAAMKRNGLANENDVAHGRYERNTVAVEQALADILQNDPPPRAVIMVGSYKPCAAFIKLSKQNNLKALFLNVSFVGTSGLVNELGADGDGVIITQVVPHFDCDQPISKQFRNSISQIQGEDGKPVPASFGAFEGFVAARIFLQAMQKNAQIPTRESVATQLDQMGTFDIGLGVPLHLSRDDHQACHTVWPTILKGSKVQPFEWKDLATPMNNKTR